MQITLNSTALMHSNIINDIAVAKAAGFDAIEPIHTKLYRYLENGGTAEKLNKVLDGFPVVGIGALWDGDRYTPEGRREMLDEARYMSDVAKSIHCNMFEVVPGPVDIDVVIEYSKGTLATGDKRHRGLLGKEWAEIRKNMADNLKEIAKIAKENGQEIYFEPLGWAPISRFSQGIEVIDEAGMDNVGLVIDTWHGYVAGDTPDDVAKIDKRYIKAVHVCDSLEHKGGIPDQRELRNVMLGEGVVYLKEWLAAIRSTGFDGWYACELFSRRHHEEEPYRFAQTLRNFMDYII